jgi:hypothetical protein
MNMVAISSPALSLLSCPGPWKTPLYEYLQVTFLVKCRLLILSQQSAQGCSLDLSPGGVIPFRRVICSVRRAIHQYFNSIRHDYFLDHGEEGT